MSLESRFIKWVYGKIKIEKVEYPASVQVLAIMFILCAFGLLYLLKNRFMPIAFIVVDAAGKI